MKTNLPTAQTLLTLFDPKIHIPKLLSELLCAKTPEAWSTFVAVIEHRMHDTVFAEAFHQSCPVDGAQASEYNYKLIQDDELSFVGSIRFAGLSLSEPFVEILLCNMPLTGATLDRIVSLVRSEYAVFAPRRIRYFSPQDKPIIADAREDFAFFVENTSTIHASEIPARFDEVTLRPAASLDFYPDLIRIYEGLKDDSHHELKPESRESLKTSLKQGLLYEAFVEDRWAGMISAHRLTERFYNGVFIVEEVLDKQFRGKGYAPAMQRKFIDQLEKDSLVFGEILYWNHRSRKTAMRVGRKKCGTTFFHLIGSG
jgi:RimJ/RimL family protein N-acetyltransferase